MKWLLFWVLLLLAIAVAAVSVHEYQTSYLQSRYFTRMAGELVFELREGPSRFIWFPSHGPYNEQRGYTRLPEFVARLNSRGYEIARQGYFSRELMDYAQWGANPPYQEKLQTGLTIVDREERTLFAHRDPSNIYTSFSDIPPLLVAALLFIENRELLAEKYPSKNPVVEWNRLAEALLAQAQSLGQSDAATPGGSTLATQMEKYRYSPGGITIDGGEKIRQMISASVRVYRLGTDTGTARELIVRDYLNSTPLAGRAGRGEIHGLGDGLRFWFGIDFDYANQLLGAEAGTFDIDARARVFRSALSLLLSQRRPSYYLLAGREELNELTNSYLRVLGANGIIDPALRDAALRQPLVFLERVEAPPASSFISRKVTNSIRTELLSTLGVQSLYSLDRFDLRVRSSVASDIQREVEAQLQRVTEPAYARAAGLLGEKLLREEQLGALRYSFLLYERTPNGNLLRVQTDNLNMPFDMNTGSKLDLGSTAKLRTLISYLEIVETVYLGHRGLAPEERQMARQVAEDPLRQWTLDYLQQHPTATLRELLAAAMLRSYSASPAESFFTAGGMHRFSNFEQRDNTRVMTVAEAFSRSVNLVFVRMMRDVARYYTLEIPGARELLENRDDPRRRAYLERFADMEGQTYLQQFYQRYGSLPAELLLAELADRTRPLPGRLSMVFRSVLPEADAGALAAFLGARLSAELLEEIEVGKLYRQYDPARFDSNDRAYLAKIHPLELWLVKYLLDNPGASLKQLVSASSEARQDAYAWLTRSRKERAQNNRIRILLEQDAFESIHQQWQRLGYPFSSLVPSYATALGASADRPTALAELMGIIVNDGARLPLRQIEELHFAQGTPYETQFQLRPPQGHRVLSREIAQTVRKALADIVDSGTARRLRGALVDAAGRAVEVGGKTGTGDHRSKTFGPGRQLLAEEVVNRNALFTFFIGDRFFGVILAHVGGAQAEGFEFTSGLPAQLLKVLMPSLRPLLTEEAAGPVAGQPGALPGGG
ncbi:MAG: transglycosylase domain-containing protein [Haliea sp.]|uniref:transglycosylase domain-containing protein n=1 Tax=Haliea sp. TaxID=1932666 RepID=UPI0032EB6576